MRCSRRTILFGLALSLLCLDALLLITRDGDASSHASITHMGLDSLVVPVARTSRSAQLVEGRWLPDLNAGEMKVQDMAGQRRRIWLVSLGRSPTYGQFLVSLRDLKRRRKCNVLVQSDVIGSTWPKSKDETLIPAFVLCGHSIGDAGFEGVLPADDAFRP